MSRNRNSRPNQNPQPRPGTQTPQNSGGQSRPSTSDFEEWQLVGSGMVFYQVWNEAKGAYEHKKVSSRSAVKRFRIHTLDRQYNEDQSIDPALSPFNNGRLERVGTPKEDSLSNDAIAERLNEAVKNDDALKALIDGLDTEILIQRYLTAARGGDTKKTTVPQYVVDLLEAASAEKFPKGTGRLGRTESEFAKDQKGSN